MTKRYAIWDRVFGTYVRFRGGTTTIPVRGISFYNCATPDATLAIKRWQKMALAPGRINGYDRFDLVTRYDNDEEETT